MKIVGEIEVNGFMIIKNLDDGDVFIFLDEGNPYMVGTDEYSGDTYVINLKTGIVTNIDETEQWWADRPIEKLNAELVVK